MITTFLDINNAHITKADLEWLGVCADQKHFIEGVGFPYRYDCGFFISLGDPDDSEMDSHLSPMFKDVLEFARKNECTLIRLDSDGPFVETLQTND